MFNKTCCSHRGLLGWYSGRMLEDWHRFYIEFLQRDASIPCVSKQCPADGVWRIGRGGSPDRVLKTRFAPSESSAGHGLPPQRAPKQCPANGVRRVLWGFVSRHGLLDTVKKHMAIGAQKLNTNFFFLKLFGHRRDIPAKSRDIPPKKFDFPGFEGHTELFGPHPFTWKTPSRPKISGPKSLGLGSFFVPESMRAVWSDRQTCSHNVSQKFKPIRRSSEYQLHFLPKRCWRTPQSEIGIGREILGIQGFCQALPRRRLVRRRLVTADGVPVSATLSRPERGRTAKSLRRSILCLFFQCFQNVG